ncbi:MAG: PqqD family protein [Pseudomonadales bacterium]
MLSKLPVSIPKHVIHDAFDEDVVVVNLNSGSYYSLTALAAELWLAICEGADKQAITERFGEAASEQDLDKFLALLVSEGLLEEPDGVFNPIEAEELTNMLHSTPFEALLEKHTDVEELLLIDPIHEVDSAGWPNTV